MSLDEVKSNIDDFTPNASIRYSAPQVQWQYQGLSNQLKNHNPDIARSPETECSKADRPTDSWQSETQRRINFDFNPMMANVNDSKREVSRRSVVSEEKTNANGDRYSLATARQWFDKWKNECIDYGKAKVFQIENAFNPEIYLPPFFKLNKDAFVEHTTDTNDFETNFDVPPSIQTDPQSSNPHKLRRLWNGFDPVTLWEWKPKNGDLWQWFNDDDNRSIESEFGYNRDMIEIRITNERCILKRENNRFVLICNAFHTELDFGEGRRKNKVKRDKSGKWTVMNDRYCLNDDASESIEAAYQRWKYSSRPSQIEFDVKDKCYFDFNENTCYNATNGIEYDIRQRTVNRPDLKYYRLRIRTSVKINVSEMTFDLYINPRAMTAKQLSEVIFYQTRKRYRLVYVYGEDVYLKDEYKIWKSNHRRLNRLESNQRIADLISTNRGVLQLNLEMNVSQLGNEEKYQDLGKRETPIDSRKCKNLVNGGRCNIWNAVLKADSDNNWNTISNDQMQHLESQTHCDIQKRCEDGYRCAIFKRMENQQSNAYSDCLHMILYRHPPRRRRGNIKLPKNCGVFHYLHKSVDASVWRKNIICDLFHLRNDCLQQLLSEIKANGFENKLRFGADYITARIDRKMAHPRHRKLGNPLNRAQMAAIILYTDTSDLYGDLGWAQRDGDYDKYKIWDFCLYSAIRNLNAQHRAKCKLYSGVAKVMCTESEIRNGYFSTYMSSSMDKGIAENFSKIDNPKQRTMVEFDENMWDCFEVRCADVSWISQFDESEVLFSRTALPNDVWKGRVVDQTTTLQQIVIKPSPPKYQHPTAQRFQMDIGDFNPFIQLQPDL